MLPIFMEIVNHFYGTAVANIKVSWTLARGFSATEKMRYYDFIFNIFR